MVLGGWSLSFKQNYINIDYSFYLGPDYKATQKLPKRAPTVVSNHVSWADSILLEYSDLAPSFSAKIEAMKVWCLNIILVGNRGIFIARGGTDAERQANIN